MNEDYQLEQLRRMLMDPELKSGLYLIDTALNDRDIEIVIHGICGWNYVKEQLMTSMSDSPFEMFVTGLSFYCKNEEIQELRKFLLNPGCKKNDSILYGLLINIIGNLCSVSKTIIQVFGDNDLSVLSHEDLNKINGALQHHDNKAIIVCKNKSNRCSGYDPLITNIVLTNVRKGAQSWAEVPINRVLIPSRDVIPAQISTIIQYGTNSLYVGNNSGTIIFGSGTVNRQRDVRNEAYFNNIADQIINDLDEARVSIHVCIAWFTNQRIADKLIEKHHEGLDVKIVSFDDHINAKFGVNIEGIPHKRIKGTRGGTMHNKFCVIDNQKVITGSYNWSENAEKKNDENAALMYDDKCASDYTLEFKRLFETE